MEDKSKDAVVDVEYLHRQAIILSRDEYEEMVQTAYLLKLIKKMASENEYVESKCILGVIV